MKKKKDLEAYPFKLFVNWSRKTVGRGSFIGVVFNHFNLFCKFFIGSGTCNGTRQAFSG